MATKTTKWDAANYLDTIDDIGAYLEAVFEEDDTSLVIAAIGDIARSKGMTEISRKTGLSRESLYKSLSEGGNPAFSTIVSVLHSLGLRLEVKVIKAA